MERILYSEEHLMFRDAVRTFLEREVVPNQKAWNDAGIVSRDAWRRAGEAAAAFRHAGGCCAAPTPPSAAMC